MPPLLMHWGYCTMTVSLEFNIEYYFCHQEEIERLNKELHESIDQNAELCEKVIMAESAHEAIKKKLDELKEKNK